MLRVSHNSINIRSRIIEIRLYYHFVDSQKKYWNSFLSPVDYKNEEFVWVSTGQSAAYVADKLYLIPQPSFLRDNLLILTSEGAVTTCDRYTCNARAFCQANDDYYAYDDDYVTRTDFADFDDI